MAMAEGRSLKEVLDLIARSTEESAQKAAAWFAALLIFVIVPLWGKMLLVIGCCHADPHPGNFKVDGIPGLEEAVSGAGASPTPSRRTGGLLSRFCGGVGTRAPEPPPPLTLWVLDWGSCVDLEDGLRQTLCRLLLGLSKIRSLGPIHTEVVGSGATQSTQSAAQVAAEAEVADCIRALGVQSDDDSFLAALGMALFDPSIGKTHPRLHGGRAEEELGRSFPTGSGVGKVLRVVAILVGICRELEMRLNDEVAERLPSSQGERDRPFVELFLVELWRSFAEEGLA